MNRDLEFPFLPKTIAVISSQTAAGFGDFMNQLEQNAYGFRFQMKLFPAVMQGEQTIDSIIAALERIYAHETFFDLVVLIRGGRFANRFGEFRFLRIGCPCGSVSLADHCRHWARTG